MIYLDNCATTKVKKEVIDEMVPYFLENYGNPESKYYSLATTAKTAVEKSKDRISHFIGCNFGNIYFNSGSTEGNNTIIKGVADYYSNKGNHIITTCVEHSSVLETCRFLETKGYRVTYLPVDKNCQINIDHLRSEINDKTILVSIMWVNNEVGSIMPIKEIAEICYEKKVLFHSDATQAIGKIKINFNELKGLNFITFSGHKIYGPKGIGCLISKKDPDGITIRYTPLLHGGEQEDGFRAGTLNVPGIVGIGKACELQEKTYDMDIKKLFDIEGKIKDIIIEKYSDIVEFNNSFPKVPGIINLRFKGINNQILLKKIGNFIAASTGSACSNLKPSYVLLSMGKTLDQVYESIRISFSPHLTDCEIESLKLIL